MLVHFADQYQKLFKFYKGGDGPPRYSILNFQKQMDGSYVWKEIGSSYCNLLSFSLEQQQLC